MANTLSPAVRLALVVAGTAVVAVAITAGIYLATRPTAPTPAPPPAPDQDPRVAYTGPYLNVRPDVQYVGDAVCAGCHHDRHETFRHHPMGRSMAVAEAATLPPTDANHHSPFTALGATFRVGAEGGRVVQTVAWGDAADPVCEKKIDVKYVIGSGNHGHSYLADRGGHVYQTPVSWFSHKQIWDVSPGWSQAATDRVIQPQCLYCHANHVEHVDGTLNKYREPVFGGQATIGCERCHGPGALHAETWNGKRPAAKGRDYTIVNPKDLSPALREAVCQQCHLEGEHRLVRRGRDEFDFRPGLPLQAVLAVVVREGDNYNAVNHVEQMYQSRCFTQSGGQMGCISCHDPHVKPSAAERVPYFRARCLACHESQGCSVPREQRVKTSPQDSCIDCHMGRYLTADIVHTASHDHRIPRRAVPPADRARTAGATGLRLFFESPTGRTQEDDRDFGVALARLAAERRLPPELARQWGDFLDAALARHPDDVEALEAKAMGALAFGNDATAQAALAELLAHAPNHERALVLAGGIAQKSERVDAAIGYWTRAVTVNPWEPRYYSSLAYLSRAKADWAAVRTHTEAWLRLEPSNTDARRLRVESLLRDGKRAEAAAEFAKIEKLKPRDLDVVRDWYNAHSKSGP